MARVTGSLASVNSVPTEGTVLVRALTLRPGSTFAVTGEPKVAVIKAGAFTIEDVEPGPVQLTIQGNGVTHDIRVDVPDEDEVDFLDLLDDVYDWEPAQISAVKLAAREARKAADEAREVAEYFGDVSQVKTYVDDAHTASESAGAHADRAAGYESTVAAHADRAEAARDEAGGFSSAAEDARRGAVEAEASSRGHAAAAADSEAEAASQAGAAKASAESAAGSASSADAARVAAEKARDSAGAFSTAAGESASEAAAEASMARSAAETAAEDVRSEVAGFASQAATARDEAEHHADLSEGSAVRAEAAARSAESAVSEGMPLATSEVAGAVVLAGDLAGTHDSPTVPGLRSKADLTEVQGAIDGVDSATSSATPGTIARRSAQGTLSVGAPTASDHAATRQHVSDQVATRAPLSDYTTFKSATNQTLTDYAEFRTVTNRTLGEYGQVLNTHTSRLDGLEAQDAGFSTEDRQAVLGMGSGGSRMHGTLRWSGPTYSPAARSFTRLRGNSDGRLVVARDTGGVARGGTSPSLYIPRSGLWLLSVTQAWLSDTGARGAGLGESTMYGDRAMRLWADIGLGRFITATRLVYLTEGTTLYPWVWVTETGSQMAPEDREISSEYSATYIGM